MITSSIQVKDNLFMGLALIKNNFIDNDICFSERFEAITLKKPISFAFPF